MPDEWGPQLRALLREAYGLAARRLVRLPGADPIARAYRLETDTAAWFVKVRPGRSGDQISARIGEHLAVLKRPELLEPVRSTSGELITEFAEFGGSSVVVWPYADGRDGFEVRHSPDTLHRVGSVLRAVHDLVVPVHLAEVVPVNDPTDRWRHAVTDWYGAQAPTGDEVIDQLVRLLYRRRELITGLVTGTARLSDLMAEPEELVLCHGDLHAGNVLVDVGGRVTITDWDSAVLGDRERDLMFPGAAIGGAWSHVDDVAAFHAGYGPLPGRELDRATVAFYRGDRVLADVALFTEQILDRANDDRARALRFLTATLSRGDAAEVAARTIAALD